MMLQELLKIYIENKKGKVRQHFPLFAVGLTMNERTLILVNQMFCNEAEHRPLTCGKHKHVQNDIWTFVFNLGRIVKKIAVDGHCDGRLFNGQAYRWLHLPNLETG
jgi:hypothetical protein